MARRKPLRVGTKIERPLVQRPDGTWIPEPKPKLSRGESFLTLEDMPAPKKTAPTNRGVLADKSTNDAAASDGDVADSSTTHVAQSSSEEM